MAVIGKFAIESAQRDNCPGLCCSQRCCAPCARHQKRVIVEAQGHSSSCGWPARLAGRPNVYGCVANAAPDGLTKKKEKEKIKKEFPMMARPNYDKCC